MSANNQVIIRKVSDNKFEGFDVDVDALGEVNTLEDAAWNNGKPVFTAITMEEAVKEYLNYCKKLAESGMTVEYGLGFVGV